MFSERSLRDSIQIPCVKDMPSIDVIKIFQDNQVGKREFLKKRKALDCIQNIVKGKIESIEVFQNNVVINLYDGRKYRWRMNSYEDNNFTVLTTTGQYEDEDEELIRKMVTPNSIILDIGANKGWHTILFSLLAPNGKVYAFEPTPSAFAELNANIELNKLQNVISNKAALLDEMKRVEIFVPYHHSPLASLGKPYNTEYESFWCNTDTIDHFSEVEMDIKKADFVKIDAEGSEEAILLGGRKLFETDSAPILLIEIFEKTLGSMGSTTERVITLIKSFGYELFVANGWGISPFMIDYFETGSNVFCLKKAHMAKFNSLLRL